MILACLYTHKIKLLPPLLLSKQLSGVSPLEQIDILALVLLMLAFNIPVYLYKYLEAYPLQNLHKIILEKKSKIRLFITLKVIRY